MAGTSLKGCARDLVDEVTFAVNHGFEKITLEFNKADNYKLTAIKDTGGRRISHVQYDQPAIDNAKLNERLRQGSLSIRSLEDIAEYNIAS
jgi:hypothetical protein